MYVKACSYFLELLIQLLKLHVSFSLFLLFLIYTLPLLIYSSFPPPPPLTLPSHSPSPSHSHSPSSPLTLTLPSHSPSSPLTLTLPPPFPLHSKLMCTDHITLQTTKRQTQVTTPINM